MKNNERSHNFPCDGPMTHVGIVISERKLEEAQISNMFCDFCKRDYHHVVLYLLDEVNYDELRLIELFTISLSFLVRVMLKSLHCERHKMSSKT